MNNPRELLQTKEYEFLRTNPHLGENICYLTLAGSRAYGTYNENSDTDVRGFALERPSEIFGNDTFEQLEDRATDTVIYALKKYVNLCRGCNPNVIEMLGTREQDILYMNDIGKRIRDNAKLFLSRRAYATFAGYATMQLRRLENALAHDSYNEREKEQHILKSIRSMMRKTEKQYRMNESEVAFYIPEEQEPDIHLKVNIAGMPLRAYLAMNSDLNNMLRNYDKLNHRNRKKDDNHLQKHAMHLVRLYLTGKDVLEKGEIITCREKELPLLRAIRNGEVPLQEVVGMAEKYELELERAYKNSVLPEKADDGAINELLIEIYRKYL